MKARLRVLPFDTIWAEHQITEICTLTELLQKLDADDEFYTDGKILIDDHEIYQDKWGKIKVRPEPQGFVDICLVPGNKSTAMLLASVALAVAVTAVSGGLLGPAGLGILGSSFAAGGLGASLAAAGIGLAGAYALGQLTSLPPTSQNPSVTGRPNNQAGITANALRPDELLPLIIGEIGYSPPQIMRAYTTFNKDEITVHGTFGVEGRCSINGIKVDGNDISLMENILYETREGSPGDLPLTLNQLTCIQDTGAVSLSKHDTIFLSSQYDQVADQITPDNSVPKFHNFRTRSEVNEIWIRILFPGGIVYTPTGVTSVVPIKIELRKVGDVSWRGLPILYVYDERKATGSLRVEVKLKFERIASGQQFGYARLEYPIYAAKDENGLGKAWEYLADPYFHKGANPPDEIPVMTSGTTSGVTITHTGTDGTGDGWRACDNSPAGTYWSVLTSTLPQSITVDFGSGNTETIKSFYAAGIASSYAYSPRAGFLEGSNNNVNWTLLSTVDEDSAVPVGIVGFVHEPAAYRYYRFTVTRSNDTLSRLAEFQLWADDAYTSKYAAGGDSGAHYVSLNENGATVFLDPDDPTNPWDIGAYEVRVKRGTALVEANTDVDAPGADSYAGNTNATYWFSYLLSSGVYFVAVAQRNFRSDCLVEVFSSVKYDPPVDTNGICCIAIEAKNLTIQSVYAVFKSYAPIWDYYIQYWNFFGTDAGWTVGNANLILSDDYITIGGPSGTFDMQFIGPEGLNIDGSKHFMIDVEIMRTAGAGWDGSAYYKTAGHGFTNSFREVASQPAWTGDFLTITYDMTALSSGGSDWITNTITQIRLDFGNTVSDIFRVRSVRIRRNDAELATWSELQAPTSNPAALYRAVLLGYGNADPAPGEVIQQDVFEDWYGNCVARDHECNMVVSGQVIRDVKQIIATCGMASPRDSNELGIIEDLDTSAQPPRNPLTPANSKNLGSQLILPVLPHGVRVEFFDEDDDYKINAVTIYRDGYDVSNAVLFETRRYPGFTNVTRVTARAIFDLEQIQFRARRYIREVGIEGLNFERGQLSSINDDVLEPTQAAGWIKSVQTSGADIVSITLTNVMPWGRAQGDIAQIDDITDLTDVLDVDVPMGVFIRDHDGNEIYKQVSDVTDSNVCTFLTPFLAAGSGIEPGLMVGAGKWGNLERRVKLIAKKPKSMDKWILELADEAPQLFLP